MFEKALAHTIVSCPDVEQEVRWKMIASLLPNRTPEDIGKRYERLVSDVQKIESGQNVTVTYKVSTKDSDTAVPEKDDEVWIKKMKNVQKQQQSSYTAALKRKK